VGSTIRSQGDVSIVATAGDLSIIGSQVKGDNVALAARDNITLRSEAEDHTQSSKNKSGSGEIGFSIGAQTGWYVSASTAKGKGSGNGTTHVETVVDADRNLTVISGKDTTLQGAQLSGDKVVASIGGNLSIISEQDTDDYASKQSQADGTFLCGSERWSGGQHLSFVARRGCLQLCYQPSLAPPERCWRPMEWSVVGGCWQSLVR